MPFVYLLLDIWWEVRTDPLLSYIFLLVLLILSFGDTKSIDYAIR